MKKNTGAVESSYWGVGVFNETDYLLVHWLSDNRNIARKEAKEFNKAGKDKTRAKIIFISGVLSYIIKK